MTHPLNVDQIIAAIEVADPKQLRDNLNTITRALQARAQSDQSPFK